MEQYNNFKDSESGLYLNGTITNKEDVADNLGVSLAYETYINVVKDMQDRTLIAFKKYNPRQMFWISYAQFYCSIQRKGYNKNQLSRADEPHTLNEFRVKGPLQNSEQFAKDFSCSNKDDMNPQHKCTIW